MKNRFCKDCKVEYTPYSPAQPRCKECEFARQKAKYSLYKKKLSKQAKINKLVRERDEGMPCISCGEYKPLEAGHYIAVSKSTKLRYDLRNIHGQCRACNGHPLYGNLVNYRKGLISRCGLESVEWLHNNK